MKDLLHSVVETSAGLGQIIEVYNDRFKVQLDTGEGIILERADFDVLTRVPDTQKVIEGLGEMLEENHEMPGVEHVEGAKFLLDKSLSQQVDSMMRYQKRLAIAKAWANGRWVPLDSDRPPERYGLYQLDRYGNRGEALFLHWFKPYNDGSLISDICVESPVTGSSGSWEYFCNSAKSHGAFHRWSEPLPTVGKP